MIGTIYKIIIANISNYYRLKYTIINQVRVRIRFRNGLLHIKASSGSQRLPPAPQGSRQRQRERQRPMKNQNRTYYMHERTHHDDEFTVHVDADADAGTGTGTGTAVDVDASFLSSWSKTVARSGSCFCSSA